MVRKKEKTSIRLIIDIPEKLVRQARSYGDFPYDDYGVIVEQAIINGIELPEGHCRLIDADDLQKQAIINCAVEEAVKAMEEEKNALGNA